MALCVGDVLLRRPVVNNGRYTQLAHEAWFGGLRKQHFAGFPQRAALWDGPYYECE